MNPEDFHTMIIGYDPEIDGYWMPTETNDFSGHTVVAFSKVNGSTAQLYCSNYGTESMPALSIVQMEYSDEHGWRFASCSALPSEELQTASSLIAGDNAQGTAVTLEAPASWEIKGDRFFVDGWELASFGIIGRDNIDVTVRSLKHQAQSEYGFSITTIEEMDLPGIVGIRCAAVIENLSTNRIENGYLHYIGIENRTINLSLFPDPEKDRELQLLQFETCLATLRLG